MDGTHLKVEEQKAGVGEGDEAVTISSLKQNRERRKKGWPAGLAKIVDNGENWLGSEIEAVPNSQRKGGPKERTQPISGGGKLPAADFL